MLAGRLCTYGGGPIDRFDWSETAIILYPPLTLRYSVAAAPRTKFPLLVTGVDV